jgi:branched-chain amino acid aminotransferase
MSPQFAHTPNPAPVSAERRSEILANPGFGRYFTDHMVTIRWSADAGWHDAAVVPYGPLTFDPATMVLHYGQEIFEGLKAYRRPDGSIASFRPEANAARFRRSAERMAMAPLPDELFLASLEELIRVDQAWIPTDEDGSLYLRPIMYASEAFLGVRPAAEYLYLVIACPVGSYFKGGVKPVAVWASRDYTRAAPGGTGAAKCGGNYAASLSAQAQAIEHGYEQVVFLDAVHRRYVDELGGMNAFFVYDDGTLVTPPCAGTILEGITRDSVMTLARENGMKVVERPFSYEEWVEDARSGRLTEAFACGTAAVVTPIGRVGSVDGEFTMAAGEVTARLRAQLVDIQRGRVEDRHGWVRKVL